MGVRCAKWWCGLVVLLAAGMAQGETQSLELKSAAWNANPLTWKFCDDGLQYRLAAGNDLAVYEAAPLAKQVTVECVVTPRETNTDRWCVASVAIVDDPRNYWHLALVQSPPDLGKRPSVELAEMHEGVWLSQTKLKMEINELVTGQWKFGQSYRLQLSMDAKGVTGTITTADNKPLLKRRYAFNAPAVMRGRPGLHVGGIASLFSDLRAKWSETITAPQPTPTFPPFAMAAAPTGIKEAATGFFHVKQMPDGRWWAIDPQGRGVVLLGVDHVTFQGHWCEKLGYAPHGKKNAQKYASHEVWEEEALQRLKKWGFTMLGAGCDPKLNHRGLAHTLFLSMGSYLATLGDEYDLTPYEHRPCSAFPNVFHPDYAAFCRYRAREMCTPNRNDPWLFGYFIDNELAWWGRGPMATGLFDAVMKKGAQHTGKIALRDFLAKDAGQDVAKFNARWGTSIKTFDELLTLSTLPSETEEQRNVKHEFLRFTADRYFAITTQAIRDTDPNHLVLGARFAGTGGADPVVWEVSGKYCDVVTFNCYPTADLDEGCVYVPYGGKNMPAADHFQQYYDYVKRPMLITEWSFPALDAGLPSVHGAGQRFRTQAERTQATRLFARTMLGLPFLLGYDYFMWVDEPALGISTPFPEDSNYGLINEDGKPYELLTDMFTKLQHEAGQLRFQPPPTGRAMPKPAPLDAMTVAHRMPCKGKTVFTRQGDEYRANNGRLEIAGKLGKGHMLQSIKLDGGKQSFGQYNAMIHSLNAKQQNHWSGTKTVESCAGRIVDGIAVLEITGAGTVDGDCFEITHRLLLPPGTPWYVAECVQVRNTGKEPLRLAALYFRPYSDFMTAPAAPLPPRLWGLPVTGCWFEESGDRYFGAVAPRSAGIEMYFFRDKGTNYAHPDVRLPLDNVVVAPGATFTPPHSTWVVCVVGHGGGETWLQAATELGALLK